MGQNVTKSDNKNFEIYQTFMHNFLGQKCPNTPILCTTDAHFYNPSVKVGSISFFSFSDMQKFHHLFGCHAIGINYSLIFFKCFTFFRFNMVDKRAVLNRLKIKAI